MTKRFFSASHSPHVSFPPTAKIETHRVEGKERRLCVHRKGATRAFPPGHPETPAAYREVADSANRPALWRAHAERLKQERLAREGAGRSPQRRVS